VPSHDVRSGDNQNHAESDRDGAERYVENEHEASISARYSCRGSQQPILDSASR
jgi:hypothetical protein